MILVAAKINQNVQLAKHFRQNLFNSLNISPILCFKQPKSVLYAEQNSPNMFNKQNTYHLSYPMKFRHNNPMYTEWCNTKWCTLDYLKKRNGQS